MRLLYSLLFIIVTISMPMMAEENIAHKKLPLSESMPLLETIEGYALHMGTGSKKVHIFIDPLCPHSKNLIEMISESDKALARNSYYFYLYTLERLHSEATVAAIYSAKDPLTLLLDVMVREKKIDVESFSKYDTSSIVDAIAKVAKELDVYKRPYLIFVKKPKTKRGK